MVIVRTVEEFHKYNEKELRMFMIYKTGIRDKDLIDDTIQEFYLRLLKSKALEKFDPHVCENKDLKILFQTWVCSYFCWLLPLMKKKNFRKRFEIISNVVVERKGKEEEVSVFDFLGNEEREYAISNSYYYDNIKLNEEFDIKINLESFFKYVRKTEKPKKADQIISYINYRIVGLKGIDISILMGVSNPMVNTIKGRAVQKLSKWIRIEDACLINQ